VTTANTLKTAQSFNGEDDTMDTASETTKTPAEIEFRRRLAAKLTERGFEGAALEARIDELLRRGVKLRLDVEKLMEEA